MPSAESLSLAQRQSIFRALVATQDLRLMSVAASREHIARQHGLTLVELRQIEDEGIEGQWPPLD